MTRHSQQNLDSRRDLETALTPWMITSAAFSLVLFLSPLLELPAVVVLIASSLGSALLSVAVVLLITERVLKPLYVRDVLAVSNLSAEVYNSGLKNINTSEDFSFSSFVRGAGTVTIAGDPSRVHRVWPIVRRELLESTAEVHIHVHLTSRERTSDVAAEIEGSWGAESPKNAGRLTIAQIDEGIPNLVIEAGQGLVIGVADGNDDGLVTVIYEFDARFNAPFIRSLRRRLQRDRQAEQVPIYASKEVKRA